MRGGKTRMFIRGFVHLVAREVVDRKGDVPKCMMMIVIT